MARDINQSLPERIPLRLDDLCAPINQSLPRGSPQSNFDHGQFKVPTGGDC